MWLAIKITARRSREIGAATEEETGLVGECEYRELSSCSPYGLWWQAPLGQEILTVNYGGACLGLGVVAPRQRQLLPGEVCLYSQGGALLWLRQDGSVEINGLRITKEGEVVPPKRE